MRLFIVILAAANVLGCSSGDAPSPSNDAEGSNVPVACEVLPDGTCGPGCCPLEGPREELVGDPACRREVAVAGAAACFPQEGGCAGGLAVEWCVQHETAEGWERLWRAEAPFSETPPTGWTDCTDDVTAAFDAADECQ